MRFVYDSPLSSQEFLTEIGALSLTLQERDFNRRVFLKSIENVELSMLLNNHLGCQGLSVRLTGGREIGNIPFDYAGVVTGVPPQL